MQMKKVFPIESIALVLLSAFAVAAGLWAFNRRVIEPYIGFDRQLHRSFDSVRPGMTREKVVRLLGNPAPQDTRFHLSQEPGYEAEYRQAEESGSAYFLFWHNAVDITYAVGFDKDDKATMKAAGGT